jgi:hypothetical protein
LSLVIFITKAIQTSASSTTMSTAERFVLFLGLAFLLLKAEATISRRALGHAHDGDQAASGSPSAVFNVNSFGAKADGSTNNEQVGSETII